MWWRYVYITAKIGELPLLKILNLKGLPIEYVDNEFEGEGLIRIKRFPSLTKLNMNDLPNLRKLSKQEGQEELFPRLRNLYISNCPSFISLPENLLHNLKVLSISRLDKLQMLPTSLSSLTHLQYLHIHACPKLESLPQSIQRMENLRVLSITQGCPELRRRYDKGNGEQWRDVAHIPNVYIIP